MATIAPTFSTLHTNRDDVVVATWASLTTTDDVGAPIESPGRNDRSVQVAGTFGVGGSLSIEGSNEETPTNWGVLTDPQGNALTFTAAKIEAVSELTRHIRPHVTAGDGSTSLTASLLYRRNP